MCHRLRLVCRSSQVKNEPAKVTATGRPSASKPAGAGSSFLDDWLVKRKQVGTSAPVPTPSVSPTPVTTVPSQPPFSPPPVTSSPNNPFLPPTSPQAPGATMPAQPPQDAVSVEQPVVQPPEKPQQPNPDSLHLRGSDQNHDDEISIKLR